MEYRWTDIPRFADVEKALLQNEILGVGYPHELPRAEPKIDVKLEPIATKPESSNIKAEQVEEEEDEEERPEIEERPKSVVTPLEVTREKEPVGQGQTLPPPISARDQEYERVQPRGIDEMQAQEPRQISAGQTTIATGESGTAAISSQPAGMPVPQSLEEMEKDLDAMEEQLRKLNMGGDVDQQQKSAIV